jgi:pimeloyl-ACP methyl ester carboxylesterase
MKVRTLGLVALLVASALMLKAVSTAQQETGEGEAKQTAKPPLFPYTPQEARELEKKNALPITDFYATSKALPGPGKLIRSREFADYRFPGDFKPADLGIKAVRFLYSSKAARGEVVPASGVVLLPYGKPPARGWPVVVWAHGTSGVGRPCAPSLMKDLYYGWQGLLQWPLLGYAVVAPDYAGLGTDVPHQYLVAPAQAQDVIHAVPAARKAVPELGARWVAIGHSQGATAVLFVAELQHQMKAPDPNYLGAVALSPGTDRLPLLQSAVKRPTSHGYLAFLAYGIKAVYPEFSYASFLTPEAIKLMPVVETGGWYVTLASFAHKIPVGKMVLPEAEKNAHFLKVRAMSLIGRKRAHGPIFLAQGLEDTTIPTETVNEAYERMKGQGSTVEYRTYPGLDHDSLVFGSFRDQVRWVGDRFDGKPLPDGKGK